MPDNPHFDELFAHDAYVRALAQALVADAAGADDVAQATWLAAWKSPPRERTNLRNWLAITVRSFASKWRRSADRRSRHEERAARPDVARADRALEREEARRQIVDAVRALDAPYRTVVVLRWFEGLTPGDIARELAEPVETVRTRLKRAHGHLRDLLERDLGSAWMTMLLPLTGAPLAGAAAAATAAATTSAAAGQASAATHVTSAVKGALVMTAKAKGMLAAAAVVIVATAGWKALAPERAPASDAWTNSGLARAAAGPGGDATARAPSTPTVPIAKIPFVDRSASSPADQTAARFRILEDDGSAVAGCTCVLGRGDTRIGYGDTDADGIVAFAASDAEAWLLVLAPARPPYRCDVVPTAGTHLVRLPTGMVVNGRVTVDGMAPGEPLRVALSPHGRSPALVGLDDALRLGELGWIGPQDIKTTADADGRFRFNGISAAEVEGGAIYLSNDDWRFELAPSEQARSTVWQYQRVPFPTHDVVLALMRTPLLTGRLVRADHTGLAHARLTVFSTGPKVGGIGLECGNTAQDGRFEAPMRQTNEAAGDSRMPTKVQIDFTLPGGTAFHQNFDGDFSKTRDVGDIVMTDSWPVLFQIRDEAGLPIVGALTSHSWGGGAGRLRSDAAGEVRLQIDAAHRVVSFGAAGFIEQSIEPPERPMAPVAVVLRRGGRLEVTLAFRDGQPPSGCFVALDAKLGGSGQGQSNFDTFLSRPPGNWNPVASGRSWRWSQPAPPDGLIGVQGFKAGDVVTVAATDSLGDRGSGAPLEVTILADQITKVALTVDAPTRRFACRVVGPAGEPCEDAQVSLTPSSNRKNPPFGAGVPRDDDGLFHCERLFAERVDVMATAKGFGMVTERDVALTTAASVHIVRLVAARTVELRFVDDAGEPVEVRSFQCDVDGRFIPASTDSLTGVMRVAGLGDGTLRIVASVGSTQMTFEHPTDQPVAKLVVPRCGRVTAHLSSPRAFPKSSERLNLPRFVAGAGVRR